MYFEIKTKILTIIMKSFFLHQLVHGFCAHLFSEFQTLDGYNYLLISKILLKENQQLHILFRFVWKTDIDYLDAGGKLYDHFQYVKAQMREKGILVANKKKTKSQEQVQPQVTPLG